MVIKTNIKEKQAVKEEGMTIHFQWTSENGEFPHLYYENVNGTEEDK